MGTPEEALAAAQAEEAALPDHADEVRDRKTILAGTGQNIVGLGVYVIASFGMSILIARAFGAGSGQFGQITLDDAVRVRGGRRHAVRDGHGVGAPGGDRGGEGRAGACARDRAHRGGDRRAW